MIPRKRSADEGQALVEFALILIVILLFIFIIIEAGRLFQGWLTLQNAARSAGRYAITGQFETDCLFTFPACLDPRVQSIKNEGRRSASGLNIDDAAIIGESQSFVTEIWSVDENGDWIPDFAGGSADPIRVRVTYYMPVITPLLRPIAEVVRLRGQVVVVAEDYDQLGTSQVQSSAPPIGDAGDTGDTGPTGGLPELDLQLFKSASSLNVETDSPLDYTLDVINDGPFDAENVTVVDKLPGGTTFLNGTVTGAGTTGGEHCDYDPASQEVTCFLPNLAGDGSILNSASVTLETRSPVTPGITVNNTATVYNGTTALDTDELNNTDSVTVTIGAPSVDLAVTIVDSSPVFVSTPLTYTITAYNNGLDDATGVAVTVNLSTDLGTPTILNLAPCSIISNVMISCVPDNFTSPGDLPNGASEVFEFVVTAPDSSSTVTAIANIAGNEPDPDTDNNSYTLVTPISDTEADAYVQKSAPQGPLPVGVDFTYTIVAGNNGPDEIDSLIVTDILPDSVSLVFPLDDGCLEGSGGTVVCTTGPVGMGLSATFSITVTPTVAEIISNQVVVGGDFVEPPNSSANNFDVVDTAIGAGDLEISKTGPSSVLGGDVITYTLTITNYGPEPMTGVTVVDDLPPNMGPVSVWPAPPICSEFGGQVTCDGGSFMNIEPDTSRTVIVTGTAPAEDFFVNTATVSAVELDLDESNNTDVLTTTTAHGADMEVSKFANENAPLEEGHYANTPLEYLIQVGNNGAFSSTGSIVTDTLQTGVLFASASPECGNSGNLITCTVGILDAGLTQAFTLVVTPTIPGEITNTVEIDGVEFDPVSENDTFSVATTILPADLVIEKFGPATSLVTDTITYTIVLTNSGPAPAVNVIITDTLPLSVTNPIPTCSKGSWKIDGGLVICDVGEMAKDEVVTLSIAVTPTDIGPAVNEVIVTARGTDPSQTADDMDVLVTDILPVVDLRLQKDASHDSVIAGTNLTYTLVITNDGPSDAVSVVISDTMVSGLNFVGSEPDICSESGGVVTCNISGGIAADASATVELVVQVDPSVPHGDFIINAASVSSDEFDHDPFNNEDTASIGVLRESDLWIDKSDANDPIAAGETQVYTIQVWNDGPSDASNVVVADVLTDTLLFLPSPASSSECEEISNQTIECTILTIAAGDMVPLTLAADLASSAPTGTLYNTATVTLLGDGDDPDLSNNSDPEDTKVVLETDLVIEKIGSPKPVVAGTTFTYTLLVTNNGPSDSTGASISDSLPSGLHNEEYCEVTAGTSCTPGTPYTGTISVGPLADGESATFLIRADVSPSQSNDLINTATVDANEDDPGNDSSQDVTAVVGEADLAIAKSAAPDQVLAGELLTYTLVISNNGPSDASSITVTDILTSGLTYNSSLPNNACSGSGQSVTCTEASLAVGDTVTFTVVADVDSSWTEGATITNEATVSWDQDDPNLANNSAQSTANVNREADLWVKKSLNSASVVAGGTVVYSVTVGNDGPSDASGIVVTDILSDVLTIAGGTSGECLPPSGLTLDCDVSVLPAGTTHVLTITATLDASVAEGTTLSNSASITAANEPDPDSGNNASSVSSIVDSETDLEIEKSSSHQTVVAGTPLTYTLVVTNNGGPSDASSITVTDVLTDVLTFSATDSSAECDVSVLNPQEIKCLVTKLAVGDSITFTVVATVSSSVISGTSLANTASVAFSGSDTNPSNDSSPIVWVLVVDLP